MRSPIASGAKRLISPPTHRAVDLMEAFFSEAFPLSRIEDRLRRRAEGASLTGERLRKSSFP
jgi:hypothetical protein